MPIQQMLLGAGAVATKTYVDDVFATTLWEGNGNNSRTITTNIDTSTDGGLIWIKNRDSGTYWNVLFDSVRGGSQLSSNRSDAALAQASNVAGYVSNYSTTGFTLTNGSGSNDSGNRNGDDNVAWTFRKAPGFFDVVTYTGSSSARTISHNLGCVPGAIFIKKISGSDYWAVYHEGLDSSSPEDYYLKLNENSDRIDDVNFWNDTKPTASVFSLGDAGAVNSDGHTYIAYLFAGGGEGYNSVDMDGSGDYLSLASSADFNLNTGDWTIEWFAYPTSDTSYQRHFYLVGSSGSNIEGVFADSNGIAFGRTNVWATSTTTNPLNQWNHYALVHDSTNMRLYVNGVQGATSSSNFVDENKSLHIGYSNGTFGGHFTGKLSNFRIVKGTALYTSNFTAPTEPLTNITNTKLLCCNGDLATSSTVTPGTITANGDTHTTGTSPFTSPDAVFGESRSESVIKCGSYVGTGSAGLEVNLGFEPQWLMVKRTNGTSDWHIVDSMRGIVSGGNDPFLEANTSNSEGTGSQLFDLTARGFTVEATGTSFNHSGSDYIFLAIRRPDGYVGKPPELGTGVFAMDTGNSSSTVPCFDSGFPVDFLLQREFASQDSWITGSRHTGNTYMYTNASDAEAGGGGQGWDSNVGGGTSRGSSYQAWMWKRHAGFDVQCYTGQTGVQTRSHGLNSVPEMIWVKVRNQSYDWCVGHVGLNGGTNPWTTKHLRLNTSNAEYSENQFSIAPTSTHWSTRSGGLVNDNGEEYIAMLFSSVDGISKVGYYAGSNSTQTITTGFQPRFVIIKNITESGADWAVFDTVRGWGSGVDERLKLNSNAAQNDDDDVGAPTSTGFTVTNIGFINESGANYIYYAHA